MIKNTIQAWHRLARNRDTEALDEILADDAVFHSPVVHTPQKGKAIVKLYLSGALNVLGSSNFRYVRELIFDNEAVLEFTTEIDGILINGVDMIRWNADGKIVDFKVMIRPLKAVNLIHNLMGEMLRQGSRNQSEG
ncbi:MAG: nuclear transport factor 2 family protein [Deltaproteobacteria bacterium]|nr:nuclear transport factor 2 family protein [Deltaproteobacteria bacterium]